ncbi:universal stress protein [bacterium]|nr:universal stress protein [bacterium]
MELAFRLATTSKPRLKAAAFRVLFGDTVREIARFAELYKATVVLVPAYEQSSFSRWIHGNLNERLIRKMDCDLVFLNWASKTSQGTATRETS